MVKPMTSLEPAQHRTGRSGTIRSGLGTRSTVVSRSPGLIRARCSFGYGEFLVLCNGSQIEKASVSNSVSFQTLGPKPWGSFPTNTAEQPRHTCSQSIVKPLCLICVCDIIIYTQHIYIYIHMWNMSVCKLRSSASHSRPNSNKCSTVDQTATKSNNQSNKKQSKKTKTKT